MQNLPLLYRQTNFESLAYPRMTARSLSLSYSRSCLLLGTLLCLTGYSPASQAQTTTDNPSVKSTTESSQTASHPVSSKAAALQDAFTSVADELEPAVVTVFSTKSLRLPEDSESHAAHRPTVPGLVPHRTTGAGSGVIISSDGWVLTNDHVAGGADKVIVRMHDGREFTGVVRRDRKSDIALVKIVSPTPLPIARLGDSENVRIGQWAIAIGSPFRYEGSLSVGVISSLFRSQRITDYSVPGGKRLYSNMIQTDAAINLGNSGGPLCNIAGEVIGINTAIESERGGSIGIGFAIPINTAKFAIEQLKSKGYVEYGFLGTNTVSVTPRFASVLKVQSGALLDADPAEGTPAAKAGLRAGDVITAINGKLIKSELDVLTLVAQSRPDSNISITVVRDGTTCSLQATLTRLKDDQEDSTHPQPKARLGIEVQALTKKVAEDISSPTKVEGVVVKYIDPETGAGENEELDKDDIILRINDTNTPDVQTFHSAVVNLKSGDQVKIFYLTHKDRFTRRFVIVSVD